jgi:hypothetical protein
MQLQTVESTTPVNDYLERLRRDLSQVPAEEQEYLLEQAKARIEFALELEHADARDPKQVAPVLDKLGSPTALAQRLRAEAPLRPAVKPLGRLAACRSCRREVSTEAQVCPHCGAPFPAHQAWQGWGYEWKSEKQMFGMPLVHIAFGRDEKGKMRVAKGVVAIGQFGYGGIVIAQFGAAAVLGIGQFVVAPLALGQFALGLIAAGQFGIGLLFGAGMIATGAIARGMVTLGNWFSGR